MRAKNRSGDSNKHRSRVATLRVTTIQGLSQRKQTLYAALNRRIKWQTDKPDLPVTNGYTGHTQQLTHLSNSNAYLTRTQWDNNNTFNTKSFNKYYNIRCFDNKCPPLHITTEERRQLVLISMSSVIFMPLTLHFKYHNCQFTHDTDSRSWRMLAKIYSNLK